MALLTDDMILECVIFDGTPSREQIIRYVNFFLDLSIHDLHSRLYLRLRSLVAHHILKEIVIDGQKFYCFADCNHPAPIPKAPVKSKIIREYIDGLPEGSQFCISELTKRFECSRVTVYKTVKATPGLIMRNQRNYPYTIYIKGATA